MSRSSPWQGHLAPRKVIAAGRGRRSEEGLQTLINRRLRGTPLMVRKCPDASKWRATLGRYYLFDGNYGRCARDGAHLDLAKYAAKLGISTKCKSGGIR